MHIGTKITYFYFMKQVLFLTTFLVLASCGQLNPEVLAREYCKCRADVEAGKRTVDACRELTESHFLKLQDDEQALKAYTENILDCTSSSQNSTK